MRAYKEFSPLPAVPYIDISVGPCGLEWTVVDKVIKFLKRHNMMDAVMMAVVVVCAPLDAGPATDYGAFYCGLCMRAVAVPRDLSEHRKHCRVRLDQQLRDWTVKRTVGM